MIRNVFTKLIAVMALVFTIVLTIAPFTIAEDVNLEKIEIGKDNYYVNVPNAIEIQFRQALQEKDMDIDTKLATLAKAHLEGLDIYDLADSTVTKEQLESITNGSFQANRTASLYQSKIDSIISVEEAQIRFPSQYEEVNKIEIGKDNYYVNVPNAIEIQFRQALQEKDMDIDTKLATLAKAHLEGLDIYDLADSTVTKEQLESITNGSFQANRTASLYQSKIDSIISVEEAQRRFPSQPEKTNEIASNLPSYMLWPRTYWQEKSNWCAAGAIQTVLKYIKGSSFTASQQSIMNTVGAGPGSAQVISYLNNNLPSGYSKYVKSVWAGNQSVFDSKVTISVNNHQPPILTFANPSGSSWWPYTAAYGHFVVVNGGNSKDEYWFSDSYYFSDRVSGAPFPNTDTSKESGKLWRRWNQVRESVKYWHGQGNEFIIY